MSNEFILNIMWNFPKNLFLKNQKAVTSIQWQYGQKDGRSDFKIDTGLAVTPLIAIDVFSL